MKPSFSLLIGLLLAGCSTTATVPAIRRDTTPVPTASRVAPGLDRIIGRDAGAVIALLGEPHADLREGAGRKLQFMGAECVLDTYLYAKGSAAPIVTYVDARRSDGSPIDKALCVASFSRKR